MSYNSHHKRRERRARNFSCAEALAVARRPEEASRKKNHGRRRYREVLLPKRSLIEEKSHFCSLPPRLVLLLHLLALEDG